MKFREIRLRALAFWLEKTRRIRLNQDDSYENSFECRWQNGFKDPDPDNEDHYSIFCSMGDWNTLVTDLLEDERYDGLDLIDPDDAKILFRNYTKFHLVFSEIMTDFQDALAVFRTGKLNNGSREIHNAIRKYLSNGSVSPDELQNWFDFINKVSKHKTNNIHKCNHHISYWFEDSGQECPSENTIHLKNVRDYIDRKPVKDADTILVPSLDAMCLMIINGYINLDKEFESDLPKFEIFRNHYKGVSLE